MTRFEWRVVWSASSNIGFNGSSEWEPWEDDADSIEEVQNALEHRSPGGAPSIAEETFWEQAGLEYYAEVREAQA